MKKYNMNENKNYVMEEIFDAEQLVIGKLEYISSDVTEFGPQKVKSEQIYMFEPIIIENKIKYMEVFTGYLFGISSNGTFDLPYVVEPQKLTDVLPNYQGSKIPKVGLLLTLNEISVLEKGKVNRKILV